MTTDELVKYARSLAYGNPPELLGRLALRVTLSELRAMQHEFGPPVGKIVESRLFDIKLIADLPE